MEQETIINLKMTDKAQLTTRENLKTESIKETIIISLNSNNCIEKQLLFEIFQNYFNQTTEMLIWLFAKIFDEIKNRC